ncbi:MAG TPA: CpsB/CapC family capsule biosynthesis tyrosine phosphatase [Gemmatimonadaceae bacterium]|nr:CpsB/CapC family capsule biosynthesis tyrosine phosphatase [Gemmatimonadaceae bacterium]
MSAVDFHNHMIPGVDDGSQTVEQSLGSLQEMWDQGIEAVITTPHFRASNLNASADFSGRMQEIDTAWVQLADAARTALPDMRLSRGVELALDEPIAAMPDKRARLAGTPFVLVEFPYFAIPPHSVAAIRNLKSYGVKPIIAHPERYSGLDDDLQPLLDWKVAGAFLQTNEPSLLGRYGKKIERTAWKVLEAGLADFLSTDSHARETCPLNEVRERFASREADAQFRLLTEVNGQRLLRGVEPTPVPGIARSRRRWPFSFKSR